MQKPNKPPMKNASFIKRFECFLNLDLKSNIQFLRVLNLKSKPTAIYLMIFAWLI